MQKGRGGMGSHKHGISGVAPNNRRMVRQIGYMLDRLRQRRLRGLPMEWTTIAELFRRRGTRSSTH